MGAVDNDRVQFEVARDRVGDESFALAADREAGRLGLVGPVLAVDLSDDPLVFGVDERRFAIRPMTRGDLADVTRWVNAPHVARWWDENRTAEQVEAYYGPALAGEDPTRLWIWEVNGRSVGFAQDYLVADHPDYALLCGRPDAVGFDYAIGEAAFVGHGVGTSLLWTFLRDLVAPAYPSCSELYAAPDHRNGASRRVLAKLGATEGLWFDEPGSGGPTTVVGCSIDVAQVMGRPLVTQG